MPSLSVCRCRFGCGLRWLPSGSILLLIVVLGVVLVAEVLLLVEVLVEVLMEEALGEVLVQVVVVLGDRLIAGVGKGVVGGSRV